MFSIGYHPRLLFSILYFSLKKIDQLWFFFFIVFFYLRFPMFNLMVANLSDSNRYSKTLIDPLLKAQIENSLDLGWNPNNICLISNFDFMFMDVKSINIGLNRTCLTGSKMFAVDWLFSTFKQNELDKFIHGHLPNLSIHPVFAHDLDAWQNIPFDTCQNLDFNQGLDYKIDFKDVGISTYSNSKLNGGVVFWRYDALDIIHEIVSCLVGKNEHKEEPTLNRLLTSSSFKDRVTVLNNTFNVGCSGFVKRATRADLPIKIVHLNPYNRIAWETHSLDRNGSGIISVSSRLEKILRKYFPHLATELSDEGKARQKELIANPKSKKKISSPIQSRPKKSIKRKIDSHFYARDLRPDRQFTYKAIADCCLKLFPLSESVIDFGCGSAWMLYYLWKNYNCRVKGIEQNLFAQTCINYQILEFINFSNLSHELKLSEKFDLALCLEVVEHIDSKYADLVISNITQAAPILVFSAASPGQGGSEHVNEQPFQYWESKLNAGKFFIDPKLTKEAKSFLKTLKVKSWYSNNISIFKAT